MSYFPDQLTRKLLKISKNEWRSVVASARWAYERYELDPAPGLLRVYVKRLPEDGSVWLEYSRDITRQRRNALVKHKRAVVTHKERKARKYHREYMKEYMVSYRAGLRRRT